VNAREPAAGGQLSAPRAGIAVSCAILIGLMLIALLPMAWWANVSHGAMGVVAAIAAWSLCTVSALVALLLSAILAPTPHAMAANLGTMGIRMGAPLVCLTFLPQLLPDLQAAGFIPCLLISYLVSLAIETAIAVRHVVPTSSLQNLSAPHKK